MPTPRAWPYTHRTAPSAPPQTGSRLALWLALVLTVAALRGLTTAVTRASTAVRWRIGAALIGAGVRIMPEPPIDPDRAARCEGCQP